MRQMVPVWIGLIGLILCVPARAPAARIHDLATAGDHEEIVAELTRDPSTINAADKWGWTPLMYATIGCRVDTVRLLLEQGADPSIKDGAGLAAIDWARNSIANCNESYIQGQLARLRDNKGTEAEVRALEQRLREKFSAEAAEKWQQIAQMLQDAAAAKK